MNKKIAWFVAGSVFIGLTAVVFSVRKTQAGRSGGYVCGESEGVSAANIAETLNRLGCDSEKPFTVSLFPGNFKAVNCCYSAR